MASGESPLIESTDGIQMSESEVNGRRELRNMATFSPESNNNQQPQNRSRIPPRSPALSGSSRFYATVEQPVINIDHAIHEQHLNEEEIKHVNTNQSHRLPPWVWFILAKSVGIKVHTLDKPWFGTLLHVLTLTFAFAYVICNTWFTVYDIVSENTKQTTLSGIVVIVVGIYWVSLGIYANKLVWRLFANPKFLDSVRLHSRTVFKVSAAGLLAILGISEIAINNVVSASMLDEEYCGKVSLNILVCQVMFVGKVGYSIFAIFWNILVGIVLLSVCRTHTIGIRRFIKELEEDGRVCDILRKGVVSNAYSDDAEFDTDEEYLWDEDDQFLMEDDVIESNDHSGIPVPRRIQRLNSRASSTGSYSSSPNRRPHIGPTVVEEEVGTEIVAEINNPPPGGATAAPPGDPPSQDQTLQQGVESIVRVPQEAESNVRSHQGAESNVRSHQGAESNARLPSITDSLRARVGAKSPTRPMSVSSQNGETLRMMTVDEILHSYWRLLCRLRATSLALQRWLVAWICFVLVWSATFIIYWISHEATLSDIAQFMIPILSLPVVCSAYGEVNNEGKRMLRCVCPTLERMDMLFYLIQQPLEVNAFGFAINYSTIVGALGALGLAFSTRIIMDEINKT